MVTDQKEEISANDQNNRFPQNEIFSVPTQRNMMPFHYMNQEFFLDYETFNHVRIMVEKINYEHQIEIKNFEEELFDLREQIRNLEVNLFKFKLNNKL
jgi:hypothetical protein